MFDSARFKVDDLSSPSLLRQCCIMSWLIVYYFWGLEISFYFCKGEVVLSPPDTTEKPAPIFCFALPLFPVVL